MSTALRKLFDVALEAQPFSVTLAESIQPGCAAELLAWAREHRLPIVETHYFCAGQRPYANMAVRLTRGRHSEIVVLAYRHLTSEEIEALTQKAHHEVAL